jgi:hypothetical protein
MKKQKIFFCINNPLASFGLALEDTGLGGKNEVNIEGDPQNSCSMINSSTANSVLAGTKNSRSEGFLLAKHKHTNIPTMMEPFSPPGAWYLWIRPIGRS